MENSSSPALQSMELNPGGGGVGAQHPLPSSRQSSSSRHSLFSGPSAGHSLGQQQSPQRAPRPQAAPGSCSLAVLPPGPRRGEQFRWQFDGMADGPCGQQPPQRSARHSWDGCRGGRASSSSPRRSPAPASLIGNPPSGTAPSGCLCTGRSHPRCGSRWRSRTPTAPGTPGG